MGYYEEKAGFSIPASEHSTITSWGQEREVEAMKNMLEQYPTGLVACVSDSYDIFRACEDYWGGELKGMIEARQGLLVVRPDSGELPKVVLEVLKRLGDKFGVTQTSSGHRLLPPHIRVIQGDGIDPATLITILEAMKNEGWAADNLAFGSGGALLQKLNRDTLKCAFKCSHIQVEDQARDVYKDPVTDPGKQSKKGMLKLVRDAQGHWATACEGKADPAEDWLVEVFRDGKLLVDRHMQSIRERAALKITDFPPAAEKKAVPL